MRCQTRVRLGARVCLAFLISGNNIQSQTGNCAPHLTHRTNVWCAELIQAVTQISRCPMLVPVGPGRDTYDTCLLNFNLKYDIEMEKTLTYIAIFKHYSVLYKIHTPPM